MIEGLRFDFSLIAGIENNLLIINKMRIAMCVYYDQFPNILNYDLQVQNIIRTHFNNKHSVLKHEVGKKKLNYHTCALRENWSSLEERYLSNGIDLLIMRKYILEEDSDDKELKEKLWIVSHPEYRSNSITELDHLADKSAI
ncbi:hypothetical protein BDA99DRAFT_544061 [Phascolomyces articulosus]|uniref:Uncharacterized protein n=1 Tax=Phascolomyces articulosus TaxID=60185 RepID=A0AAD5P7L2_9FUNG|nr:hypothetical protein BDA99DRAFT_544061 [Phascolomyces articulosus]